jgi:hypothetical protein
MTVLFRVWRYCWASLKCSGSTDCLQRHRHGIGQSESSASLLPVACWAYKARPGVPALRTPRADVPSGGRLKQRGDGTGKSWQEG